MIGKNEQKIYRQLCENPEKKFSQQELARICDCSTSYVNKVIKKLEKKKFIHKPFKNSVALLDLPGLLLCWAFTRDLEDEEIIKFKTDCSVGELENSIKTLFKDYAFTLFTAAKKYGMEYVSYNTLGVYLSKKEIRKLDRIKRGNKSELFAIVCENCNQFSVPTQAFVDLLCLNTWESKLTAFKLAEKFPNFPIFGTRGGVKEIL